MGLDHPLITRGTWKAGPALDLGCEARLRLGRLHEICGRSRHTFALMVAAHAMEKARERGDAAPVLYWLTPVRSRAGLNADGITEFLDPGQIIFVAPQNEVDALWAMEEILRSGLIPVAVAELRLIPGLTSVRRLHLAAEQGSSVGVTLPVGLLLTDGDGGAPGVESRWHMDPDHGGTPPPSALADRHDRLWRLERRRARMDPPRAWHVRHSDDRRTLLYPASGDASQSGA